MQRIALWFLIVVAASFTGVAQAQDSKQEFFSKIEKIKGRIRTSDPQYLIIQRAVRLMEDHLAEKFGKRSTMDVRLVVLVNDTGKFFPNYSKKTGIPVSEEDMRHIRQKFMLSLGTPSQLPLFIRTESNCWQFVLQLLAAGEEGTAIAAALLASTFEHEIEHNVSQKDDEVAALKVELEALQWHLRKVSTSGKFNNIMARYEQELCSQLTAIVKESLKPPPIVAVK